MVIAATASLFAAALVGVAATSDAPAGEVVVTRESRALPSGCTPREMATVLIRFTNAVSQGDRKALDSLFAIEDPPGQATTGGVGPTTGGVGLHFRWYSVNEGTWRNTVLHDRSDLLAYFANRHRQSESMQLVAVDVGPSWRAAAAGISFAIRREADDLPDGFSRWARGKGEVDCAAQRIFLWGMAQEETDPPRLTGCPLPADWSPGNPIVACSRSAGEESIERVGPNARAVLPDFRITSASVRMPERCLPEFVFGKLRSALSAFNTGKGTSFARHFTTDAVVRPFTPLLDGPLTARAALARYARSRYEAGDAWTGTTLRPPRNLTPPQPGARTRRVSAEYTLHLLISTRGKPLQSTSARVVLDCRSGLMIRWIHTKSS